jgi:hypothetical protein
LGRRVVVRVEGESVEEERGKRDKIGALKGTEGGNICDIYLGCRELGLLEREILLV